MRPFLDHFTDITHLSLGFFDLILRIFNAVCFLLCTLIWIPGREKNGKIRKIRREKLVFSQQISYIIVKCGEIM